MPDSLPCAESEPRDAEDELISALIRLASEPEGGLVGPAAGATPFQKAVEDLAESVRQDAGLGALVEQLAGSLGSGLLLQLLFAKLRPGQVSPLAHGVRKEHRQGLTQRELDVLCRFAAGDGAGEAAAKLGITPGVVRKHLSHVYRKWGVDTPGKAVAVAVARGLIEPEFGQRLARARSRYELDYERLAAVAITGADRALETGPGGARALASAGALLIMLSVLPAYVERMHWRWAPPQGPGFLLEIQPGREPRLLDSGDSLIDPGGVALAPPAAAEHQFTPGHFYVSDRRGLIDPLNDYAIVELDDRGRFIRAFTGGRYLGTRLQFSVNVAFAPDGSLLATSGFHTDALLRFTRGGAKVERFADVSAGGCVGLAAGAFRRVYVTGGNPLGEPLHVFRQGRDGRAARHHWSMGDDPGHACQGAALDDDRDRVYVTYPRRALIRAFDRAGRLQDEISTGCDWRPHGVALSGHSLLYVLEEGQPRLHLYDLDRRAWLPPPALPPVRAIPGLAPGRGGSILAVGWQ